MIADGASGREVSRFVFEATEGRTADVEALQRAVSSGEELESPFTTFSDVAEGARTVGRVAGKAGQFLKDAAGNPLAATVGLLGLGQRGAQAVGQLAAGAGRKIASDPLGSAKSTLDFVAGENPLDILGPETAATAFFGPIARARKAAKAARKSAEAAGDVGVLARNMDELSPFVDEATGLPRMPSVEDLRARQLRGEDKVRPFRPGIDPEDMFERDILRIQEDFKLDEASARRLATKLHRGGTDAERKADALALDELSRSRGGPNAAKAVKEPLPGPFAPGKDVPPARPPSAVPAGLTLTDNSRIISEAHIANGGSTIDPRTGRDFGGEDVWAVATKQPGGSPHGQLFDEAPTTFEVREYIKLHKELLESDESLMVGSWFDEASEAHGKHELAITKVFPGNQQSAAQTFALENDQWGYLNLAHPEFKTVAAADEFANASLRAELDELVPARAEARRERFFELMTPEEQRNFEFTKTGRKRSQKVQDDALRVFSLMPETEQGVQMAILGSEMAHWYRSSARTLRQAFGADAPRFSALLASTSPNIAVPDNLGASLQIWRDWQALGRPTDAASITRMVDEASAAWGITPTSFNNTHKILGLTNEQLLDPKMLRAGGMLSGPKVDPFYANLVGESQRLVVDTHMKAGFGFGRDQVRVPEGLGAGPAMRDVARAMQELTGSPVDVSDVQAAQWSAIRAIRELQRKGSRTRTAEELVMDEHFGSLFGIEQGFKGKVNLPQIRAKIKEQPSFSSLIHEKQYADLVSELGIKLPAATPEAGLAGIDPGSARIADVLAFAKRMDLRDSKRFLYGAAGAMLLGNVDDADARALAEEMIVEAGLSQATVDGLSAEELGSYAGLLSEAPMVTAAELARFAKVRGLNGAVQVANDLGRGTESQPKRRPPPLLPRLEHRVEGQDEQPPSSSPRGLIDPAGPGQ